MSESFSVSALVGISASRAYKGAESEFKTGRLCNGFLIAVCRFVCVIGYITVITVFASIGCISDSL